MAEFTLAELAERIADRARAMPDVSYTASLIARGPAHCARKFGEEAVEAIVASVDGSGSLVGEAADVLYHLLVLLQAKGIRLDDVMLELERRTAQSGHAEKASRGSGG